MHCGDGTRKVLIASPLIVLSRLQSPSTFSRPNLTSSTKMAAGKIKLTTSDNEEFDVERDVAERSVLIKNMLEGEARVSVIV